MFFISHIPFQVDSVRRYVQICEENCHCLRAGLPHDTLKLSFWRENLILRSYCVLEKFFLPPDLLFFERLAICTQPLHFCLKSYVDLEHEEVSMQTGHQLQKSQSACFAIGRLSVLSFCGMDSMLKRCEE